MPNFRSMQAYKNWLAYGQFAETPGHQPVSVKGKQKMVKHQHGGNVSSDSSEKKSSLDYLFDPVNLISPYIGMYKGIRDYNRNVNESDMFNPYLTKAPDYSISAPEEPEPYQKFTPEMMRSFGLAHRIYNTGGYIPEYINWGNVMSSSGKSAMVGAGIGSFLGPAGTVAGATLGGLYGGAKSYTQEKNIDREEEMQNAENERQRMMLLEQKRQEEEEQEELRQKGLKEQEMSASSWERQYSPDYGHMMSFQYGGMAPPEMREPYLTPDKELEGGEVIETEEEPIVSTNLRQGGYARIGRNVQKAIGKKHDKGGIPSKGGGGGFVYSASTDVEDELIERVNSLLI